jgi:hypothetical protein
MLDPKGIDFVVPLGRGSQFKNCELRYCLRSLEKHAKGIRRVVIIGDEDPGFLSDNVVFLKAPELNFCREARIAVKIQWAFENYGLTDEILFGNDDYFFLRDFDARSVPYYQRGSLLAAATADKRPAGCTEKWRPEPIQMVLHATHEALAAATLPAVNYELHCPIRYKRRIYCSSLKHWWEKASKHRHGFAPRSVYANYIFRNTGPGPLQKDLKLARYFGEQDVAKRIAEVPDRFCLSYGDQALCEDFQVWLHKRFPAKSRFELP